VYNFETEETTLVVIGHFITLAQQPSLGQGLLIVKES